MNKNQNLIDLCRLNIMEENIKDSPGIDRDSAMKAIDYKKRELVLKIQADVDREMIGDDTDFFNGDIGNK